MCTLLITCYLLLKRRYGELQVPLLTGKLAKTRRAVHDAEHSRACAASCMTGDKTKGGATFEMPWMFLNLKAPMPQTCTGTRLTGKGCP